MASPTKEELDKLDKEQQIQKSQSMAQQNLDLQDKIRSLQLDLVNREARLMGMQEILQTILENAHINSSVLYKDINKALTNLADLVDAQITTILQEQLTQLSRINSQQQSDLSAKFRQQERLEPLKIDPEPTNKKA